MDYEFHAPEYFDLENPDSESREYNEHVPVTSEVTSEAESKEEDCVEVKTPKSEKTKQASQPIRHSPRLAAIAKSIRRSNASKGFVSTSPRVSSGVPKAHRRSLSEGSNIVHHFSRVEKTTLQRKVAVVRPKQKQNSGNSGLAEDDIANLYQTSQYQKVLSTNRQRSTATNCSKGPLKSAGAGPLPLKPTKPVEFQFATDSRVRSTDNINEEISMDFQRTLRSQTTVSNQQHPKGPTKVQPFNLHGSSKPKEVGQPFVSMAELNLKFQTKTPQRFRTKKHGSDEATVAGPSKKTRSTTSELTKAHTPKLTTRSRSRSVHHPSREEIEKKELEEAHKHQFKAKPINKKILDEPSIAKPNEGTKEATVPKPFNITDMKKVVTKAMEKTLLGSCPDVNAIGSAEYLASIPHGGISSSWEKKPTEVKPFSFHSRDTEMIRKKKEKIEMMIAEEKAAAEFHAQPMPIFDGVKGLPSKKPQTPTQVQPFNLQSDTRGSARQEALQRELEALEDLEKQQRKFTAQPDTVVHKQAFVPQKSNKPLTDISGFSLNTDRRAEERQTFDIHLKLKEDELMAKKMEMEERKRREEDAEVEQLRKSAVHKAQPIRQFKPVEIKHGLLPPTIPVTPNFSTDRRLRRRAKSEQSYDDLTSDSINDTQEMMPSRIVSSDVADGTFNMD